MLVAGDISESKWRPIEGPRAYHTHTGLSRRRWTTCTKPDCEGNAGSLQGLMSVFGSWSRGSHHFQCLVVTMVTYGLTITLTKISLLLMYRHIFDTPHFKTTTPIIWLVCIAWLIAEFWTNIFQCRPFEALWNPEQRFSLRYCFDLQAWSYSFTATNMAIDIIMLVMPLLWSGG